MIHLTLIWRRSSLCFSNLTPCFPPPTFRPCKLLSMSDFYIGFQVPLYFLGPRGPLVLPLMGPVPSALKIWITYIQAYMPYESCKDSSNQPYGPMASLGCPLDPLGPPGNPPIDPLRPINRSLGLIALLRLPQLPHKSHSPSSLSPPTPRHLETLRH